MMFALLPLLSLPDLGRVSIDDPCNVTVFSQHGQASVQTGSESRSSKRESLPCAWRE